jgi:hypothetical protein
MQVAIHETINKADGAVFRCTLSGAEADRWLEVPAWMFDRAACPDPPRLITTPFVSLGSLSALADLLDVALKAEPSSSNAPHSGASRFSHDQNREEDHNHAQTGATANACNRAPRASGNQRPAADRPIRRRNADGDSGMAGTTGRDTSHADRLVYAADPGTRTSEPRGLTGGGK